MSQGRESRWLRLALSPLAWPFVLLYAFLVRLKNAAYDFHILKSGRLHSPVISVGNLSVGGSGKTPMAMLLAHLLEERGYSVDVLSRGYGRKERKAMRAMGDENWRASGDEPTLMARGGLSVFVGADRYAAGLLAEQEAPAAATPGAPPQVHILDDGFQHRKLARNVDIVLLRRADLEDEMLPLGRLREPLSALERADICMLRTEDADLVPRVLALMRKTDPAHVWIVERRTIFPALPAQSNPNPSALAFCGIGDAKGFFDSLRGAQLDLRGAIAYRDHHAYSQKDIERIIAEARSVGARCLITTEKDSIRLDISLRSALEVQFPLVVADLHLSLTDQDQCMDALKSLIFERSRIAANGMR
jgi:tetraacyldisaccharide 4'-kinase